MNLVKVQEPYINIYEVTDLNQCKEVDSLIG